MTRLYIAQPLAGLGTLELPGQAVAHLRARRVAPGERLTLFDGYGGEYTAVLEALARRQARVRIEAHHAVERESPLEVTLLQAIAKGERMDFAVQKAVELGVSRIVPVLTARGVVQLAGERARRRRAHWQGIAASACEQCGRNRLPAVTEPVPLAAALEQSSAATGIVLDGEADSGVHALPALSAVTVLIGPEGGLSAAEIATAVEHGFRRRRLGPRVLRTETAAAAILSALQAVAGDFR